MSTHVSHTLFVPSDFTTEEIERENKLADAVINGGLAVCKVCGEYEAGLETPCGRKELVVSCVYCGTTSDHHDMQCPVRHHP